MLDTLAVSFSKRRKGHRRKLLLYKLCTDEVGILSCSSVFEPTSNAVPGLQTLHSLLRLLSIALSP